MFFAINNKNERVYVDNIQKGEDYYCPICHSLLIPKRGPIRMHHFAHPKGSDCSDHWHYDMSEWHKSWQKKYPAKCQEVVLIDGGVKHRADVCIGGTVIEFQHSPIKMQEYEERNTFYTAKGHKLIWLFDDSSHYKETDNYNVHIYIQHVDGIDDIYGIEHYTEDEFVALSSNGMLGRPKLYHTLYIRSRTNGEIEYFGCPVNRDGFAPRIRETKRISCDECKYCLVIDFGFVKCMGRFKDLDIDRVIECKDNYLKFVDHYGIINEEYIKPPQTEGKSIIVLAYENNPKVMVVRNIQSGFIFKIVDPVKCFEKYNKIYGFGEKGPNQYYSKSKVISYANEPNWVIEQVIK